MNSPGSVIFYRQKKKLVNKPFKILVTGANGQIGSELAGSSRRDNTRIMAASRSELDITDKEQTNQYINNTRPDLVINAAAYTAVDRAEEEPELAYAINQAGVANLAEACKRLNIPLFHISTDYVFDGNKSAPYTETDVPVPLGVYGKSKLAGEEELRNTLEQYIILRVAWVFGSSGNNFVKTMLRLAENRDALAIVDDQYGGPTPARDIAETLLTLADLYRMEKNLAWGTYHYCGQPGTSWYHFAENIFEAAQQLKVIEKDIHLKPIRTEEYPTLAQRPKNSMFNCEKILKTFKIKMPGWKNGLLNVLTELKSSNNEQ